MTASGGEPDCTSGSSGRPAGAEDPGNRTLTPASLQRHLSAAVFGHRVYYYPTIGSTNDRALDLAEAGEPEGSLVVAEEQTEGRGRRQRIWLSPARQGIYASLILRPGVPRTRAPLFTFMAAVAVARALDTICDVRAGIKWPNDVMVGNRKIAGVLGEMRGAEPEVDALVIGMGVNVNHTEDLLPNDLAGSATSARIERGGAPVDRAALLAALLEGLEKRYAGLLRNGPDDLLREWESLSVIPRGDRVVIDGNENRAAGVFAGVDREGALLLKHADGTCARVPFGELILAEGP